MSAATDSQWAAVVARDIREDGAFVYAVATTGVYCRPGCASRRPSRANVTVHPTPAAAEAKGFRACKKCRPTITPDPVAAACRAIEAAAGPVPLAALAADVGLSPGHLRDLFRAAVGVTPGAYAAAVRAGKLRAALHAGTPVAEAVYASGFGSGTRAYAAAGPHLGMPPAAFRAGGPGRAVRAAVVPCETGFLLVAATAVGVCRVEFGDAAADLEQALAARFPAADVGPAADDFAGWVTAVVDAVAGRADGAGVPLDLGGTAFQRRVWAALRRIPAGATRSYARVADGIGSPAAVRAVAGACAANVVAVLVPCHRVVRADGGMRGYRWGVARKRHLLGREAGKMPV